MDVGVKHCGHLGLLYGAHAALGMQYKDGHVFFPPQTVNSSATSITTRRANNSESMSLLTLFLTRILPYKEILKQIPDELQRNILKRKCRPMEKLKQMQVILGNKGPQWCDLGVAEGRVRFRDENLKIVWGDFRGRNVEG